MRGGTRQTTDGPTTGARALRLILLIALALVLALVLAVPAGGAPGGVKGKPPKDDPSPPPSPPPSGAKKTLVLYDTTGPFGWLGELYGIYAGNLASHFGEWDGHPVASYAAGELDGYDATIYVGSTYDEPLPEPFLDDVLDSTKPVIWIYDNIWTLAARRPGFNALYGFTWWRFDFGAVSAVEYKGRTLTRDPNNGAGIMDYAAIDPAITTVLAEAVRDDGYRFPWAIRSRNLTYVGENPFAFTTETDRELIFADLMFDALAPARPERHRALLRLEDIAPSSDPVKLKNFATYLRREGIPFGFGVSPVFRDPLDETNSPTATSLKDHPQLLRAIEDLLKAGGVMLEHGYTHQYGDVRNPYNGVTGDDFEFYRVTENADHSLNLVGPVAEDSVAWVNARIDASNAEFLAAGYPVPKIYEVPHYTASATAYKVISQRFGVRWERAIYFSGLLSGQPIDHSRFIGQKFPYVVRDIYGAKVLPENVGNFEPEPFFIFPIHTVQDVLDAAAANLVVRDGFASFYYHNRFGLKEMRDIVSGIRALGYTFVDPRSL